VQSKVTHNFGAEMAEDSPFFQEVKAQGGRIVNGKYMAHMPHMPYVFPHHVILDGGCITRKS
jgi:hypothetical protein